MLAINLSVVVRASGVVRAAGVLSLVAVGALGTAIVGCSGAPGENVGNGLAAVSGSSAVSGSTIASIAMANVGLGACSTNSLGGTAFETSCDGNGGQPEYWCADFAQWVWQEAGASTNGLDAAAGSFYVYGQNNGTLHDTPSLGDAVVFNYAGGGYADHVAIVVQVNSDGTIETVSGDWGGSGSSEAAFSSTSRADLNTPAYAGVVGTTPAIMGMTISGFVSPAGSGSSGPAPAATCVVTTTGESGTCIDTGACSSQGGTSTADYCPGAANIQCCTGVGSGSTATTAPAPAATSGGTTTSTSTAGGCYSDTLGQEMPVNACVQSSSNDEWYQCDNGEWTDRWTDPTACSGVYPL